VLDQLSVIHLAAVVGVLPVQPRLARIGRVGVGQPERTAGRDRLRVADRAQEPVPSLTAANRAAHRITPRPGSDQAQREFKVSTKKCGPSRLRQLDGGIRAAERLRSPGCGTQHALGFVEGQGISVRSLFAGGRWWFEADAWRDPEAQRGFLARVDAYGNEGLPSPEERTSREEIQARFFV
jgi:hypothetical protein